MVCAAASRALIAFRMSMALGSSCGVSGSTTGACAGGDCCAWALTAASKQRPPKSADDQRYDMHDVSPVDADQPAGAGKTPEASGNLVLQLLPIDDAARVLGEAAVGAPGRTGRSRFAAHHGLS